MITGTTSIIAHIGFPTHSFKSPQIYNPYFEQQGIDAVVVPMACPALAYGQFLRAVFSLTNVIGALITMPHKVSSVALLDEASMAVRVAGACNAVRRGAKGQLQGDLFDGEGFVRGLRRRGCQIEGARALVVGNGGVGSAIAAALAAGGIARLDLYDPQGDTSENLAQRLRRHYPRLSVHTGVRDAAAQDLVVNASPLGMDPADALPVDVDRLGPGTFVADVVMREEVTPFLRAAQARGCPTQLGIDMLFEQIPLYLEFFGLPSTTPEALRQVAKLR